MKLLSLIVCVPAVVRGASICSLDAVQETTERCCRCLDESSSCNEDQVYYPGYNCNEVDYDEDSFSCRLTDNDETVEFSDPLGLRHQEAGDPCEEGQSLCCNPLPRGVLARELSRSRDANDAGVINVNFESLCEAPDIAAVQNFSRGVTCGKRDSRLYYNHVNAKDNETNPGEWPWVVAVFQRTRDPSTGRRQFITAGTLMDKTLVVTVGHHMRRYVDNPEALIVHVGDWDLSVGEFFSQSNDKILNKIFYNLDYDPQSLDDTIEEYPHIEVHCIS